MPYITREDGERFVIPTYRDVLTVKQTSQLKKEILLLSQSYGEFITLQKKGVVQYEVAFSPDTGYLLGESVWQHFGRPLDLLYCEAIPNTTEAILVIVKGGSVYLDGSFPIDSIPEELIIFLTQQNNFEIYTYGDVPISQEPEVGKFSFEKASVKSFTVLDKPVFPTLPLLKIYQLQLVEPVLKSQGIGLFPTKQLVGIIVVLAAAWMAWTYFTGIKPQAIITREAVNPYQAYYDSLATPAPDKEVSSFVNQLINLQNIPGWKINEINYNHSALIAKVLSGSGGKIADLNTWASANHIDVLLKKTGAYLTVAVPVAKRSPYNTITPLPQVISVLVDRLSTVMPGNSITLGDAVKKGVFSQTTIVIKFTGITPTILDLIGKQLVDMPIVLHDMQTTVDDNGLLTGTINLEALGS